MAKDMQLPVGETIDYSGRSIRIVKLLSDRGYTSRVYEGWLSSEETTGEIHVAIKAMKSLDFPLARKFFEEEGGTLMAMMHYEEQASKEQRLPLKVAPIYYGKGEFEDVPYLIMEFIPEKKVPDLIQEAGGKLPEEQALTIAWHLFRTLDVLHTRHKKTYVDLKYTNMWWLESEEGGSQLKLLDFGTLEEIKPGDERPRGVSRDLLQGGVYLCHMITGTMPGYSMVGYLRERAEPIIRKAEMSWGARQLLFHLVHRNPQARPVAAAHVASELRTLVSFWGDPMGKVLDAIQNLLSRAEESIEAKEDAKAYEFARRAWAALDIARIRQPEDEGILLDIGRAEKILAISDYLERGKTLLLARSYDDARNIFEQGMQWSEDPAPLRRWAYLARIGQEISPTTFEEHVEAVTQMLDWMNEGDWIHSLERIEELRPSLQSSGLEALHADIQLFSDLTIAEKALSHPGKEDYAAAADALRQAVNWWKTLPDADFVHQEELGDLYLQVREVENLRDKVGEARSGMSKAKELLSMGKWEDAVDVALEAVSLDRGNPEHLGKLLEMANIALGQHNYSAALQFAKIGICNPHAPKDLQLVFSLARWLWEAERALIDNDQGRFFYALRVVETAYSSHPKTKEEVQGLYDRAADFAAAAGEIHFLEELAKFHEERGDQARAAERRRAAEPLIARRDEDLQKSIDNLMAEATRLMGLENPDPNRMGVPSGHRPMVEIVAELQNRQHRLQKIAQIAADAVELVCQIDYRKDEVIPLFKKLKNELEKNRKQTEKWEQALAANQKKVEELLEIWSKLREQLEWSRERGGLDAPPQAHREIARGAGERLDQLIQACYRYQANVDPGDEKVKILLAEIARAQEGGGGGGGKTLKELAGEHIDQINAQFKAAQDAYRKGDFEQAVAEVDRLADDFGSAAEWHELRQSLTKIGVWRAWQQGHEQQLRTKQATPDLLKSLRDFSQLNLPAVYYQPAVEFLQHAHGNAKEIARKHLSAIVSDDFVQAIRLWVEIEWTERHLRNKVS